MTRVAALALVLVLGATMLLLLGIGAYPISITAIVSIVASLALPFTPFARHATPCAPAQHAIVTIVRLPRIRVATFAGAGLGTSGAVLYGLMRNLLIGPGLVGVTSGAAVGGIVAILIGAGSIGIDTGAFVGGATALIAAFALARVALGSGILAFVLRGNDVSAFLSTIVGLIESVAASGAAALHRVLAARQLRRRDVARRRDHRRSYGCCHGDFASAALAAQSALARRRRCGDALRPGSHAAVDDRRAHVSACGGTGLAERRRRVGRARDPARRADDRRPVLPPVAACLGIARRRASARRR